MITFFHTLIWLNINIVHFRKNHYTVIKMIKRRLSMMLFWISNKVLPSYSGKSLNKLKSWDKLIIACKYWINQQTLK